MMMTLAEAAQFIRERDGFLIMTHKDPDGDTLGSAAGLCIGLRSMGKRAYVARDPDAQGRFIELAAGLYPPDGGFNLSEAVIIAVDIAAPSLFPAALSQLAEHITLAIDHHPGGGAFAPLSLIDTVSAATGELVCLLLHELGVTFTLEMAEPLYIAIVTDTGCLRFDNTTSRTLRITAGLMDTGLKTGPINTELFERRALSRMALEAALLEDFELLAGGRVAMMFLTREKLERTAATVDDTDGIASMTRRIGGVEIGLLLREEQDGQTKFSVRTGPDYNAGHICAHLGGGGHARAAGATLDAPLAAA
ncbi:MAG: DHH family phosphoesterase, partial [Oscillospiraceae bacterium]|nr:DHH family phosphoesterase [Oscillospiraceae bacterium]